CRLSVPPPFPTRRSAALAGDLLGHGGLHLLRTPIGSTTRNTRNRGVAVCGRGPAAARAAGAFAGHRADRMRTDGRARREPAGYAVGRARCSNGEEGRCPGGSGRFTGRTGRSPACPAVSGPSPGPRRPAFSGGPHPGPASGAAAVRRDAGSPPPGRPGTGAGRAGPGKARERRWGGHTARPTGVPAVRLLRGRDGEGDRTGVADAFVVLGRVLDLVEGDRVAVLQFEGVPLGAGEGLRLVDVGARGDGQP